MSELLKDYPKFRIEGGKLYYTPDDKEEEQVGTMTRSKKFEGIVYLPDGWKDSKDIQKLANYLRSKDYSVLRGDAMCFHS